MAEPRAFRIDVPQAVLDRITARVRDYDWHEMPRGEGLDGTWAYGANLEFMRDLCSYWVDQYEWRKAEAALNRFPQFMAKVGDLDIHYIHAKGSGPAPRPLLMSHGWPGSIFEFEGVIEALTHPERSGGDPADAFDVIAPSLPGYGWSAKPARPIGPRTVARHFDPLMTDVLGYGDYIAQGGDWGAVISSWLGYEGKGCRAIHLNMNGWRTLEMKPQTPEEIEFAQRFAAVFEAEGGYFREQATKPQTLSYGMMDSPVGVAAWIVEKFHGWSDITRGFENVYTRDQLLTNVMIYLVTRTFNTATWLYRGLYEDPGGAPLPEGARIERPCGVANFPHDFIGWPPRSLVERGMNVVHWTDMGEGGHFAAMEKPEKFVADIRAFARKLG